MTESRWAKFAELIPPANAPEVKEDNRAQIFISEYNRLLERLAETRTDEEDDAGNQARAFRASKLYMGDRYWYYYLTNAPAKKGLLRAETVRVLDNGTYAHDRLRAALQRLDGEVKVVQAELAGWDAELKLSGHCDYVIRIGSEEMLLEFKTIATDYFHLLTEPQTEHVIQATGYHILFGHDQCLFLYEDKNTQRLKAFIHQVKLADAEEIRTRIRRIWAHVADRTLPPKCAKCWSTRCSYTSLCKKDGGGTVAAASTVGP